MPWDALVLAREPEELGIQVPFAGVPRIVMPWFEVGGEAGARVGGFINPDAVGGFIMPGTVATPGGAN